MAKKKTKIDREIARAANRGYQGPDKPPGLKRREQELASALSERKQFAAEADSPITGNVHTKEQVARARRNLKRQQKEYKRRGGS